MAIETKRTVRLGDSRLSRALTVWREGENPSYCWLEMERFCKKNAVLDKFGKFPLALMEDPFKSEGSATLKTRCGVHTNIK